jgi:hypothetical protein
MTVASKPPILIEGEEIDTLPTRVLLGWASSIQEAQQLLLGRQPSTQDEDADRVAAAFENARRRVQERSPVTTPAQPLLERPPEIDRKLLEVAARPDVKAGFAGLNWRPELVDLRAVFSFQKAVSAAHVDSRVPKTATTDELFEVCLPTVAPAPPQGALTDQNGRGFTVSAINPNLRHAGSHVAVAMVSPGEGLPAVPMQAITLFVNMGSSFLQVASYKGRCFVRDGYHRSAALLRRGIHAAPCIFIEARNFEELSCPPGSLTFEILYGERPPTIADFWDDAVSTDGLQLAVRKVVRVTVEEFIVPR